MNNIEKLIEFLSSFITTERLNRINCVLDKRTKYITVVLEDIFQSHNISAVLRSCDCFGINDIHLIENKNKFVLNPEIELGSSNWLNILRYNNSENNTLECINKLKSKGYRIISTTPGKKGVNLEDFDLNKGPVALFFGTELTGLSELVFENCDEFLKIPLYGFTESLNISVSVAVILNHLYNKLIKSEIDWKIKVENKNNIKVEWLRRSIKKSGLLEVEFYKKLKNQ